MFLLVALKFDKHKIQRKKFFFNNLEKITTSWTRFIHNLNFVENIKFPAKKLKGSTRD